MKAYILSGRLKPKYYSVVNKVNKGLFYEGQEMHPPLTSYGPPMNTVLFFLKIRYLQWKPNITNGL